MDWLLDDTDTETETNTFKARPWKIAIVDDDPQVHNITKLSLKNFEFEGRPLEFIYAYSGHEAKEIFKQHNDIAMVLLDVVMEENHSGLDVVKYIREELGNHYTRVILRTGQPGTTPEEQIIREYDIDGYKAKTEFTSKNLSLLLYTTLRSYRDVNNIHRYQNGLKAVINAMNNLAQVTKVSDFAAVLMEQLAIVLNSDRTEFIIQDSEAFALADTKNKRWHITVNGLKAELLSNGERTDINEDFVDIAEQALAKKDSILAPPLYAHYYLSKNGAESVFILRNSQLLSEFNQGLLKIFSQNAVLTLENLFQRKEQN